MSTPGTTTFTPELGARILAKLREGPPFLALAAEACGVPRKRMGEWLQQGQTGSGKFVEFTAAVRQVRAEWMLDHLNQLLATNRDTEARAKQLAWVLARLDRELFDPPRQAELTPLPEPAPAEVRVLPSEGEIVQCELEKPEGRS